MGPASSSGDHGPLTEGQDFGTRYHITRLLGIGGMGAVYEAWDSELGVTVAVKVVRPEVAANPAAARELERRFKRELLLARQVTHRNVVRIHDLGEINGIKYITMPFIDGEDLATILKREGRLPIERALPIMRTTLAGLVAAHKAGVVHRDLKPANLMIEADGQAMIMDFGIARSAGPSAGEPAPASAGDHAAMARLQAAGPLAGGTRIGAVVGTLEYMAPEQARGEEVDERADIYAFGLICYDMLVGRERHSQATSAVEALMQRMKEPPPPPRTLDPSLPEALDRIVYRCVQPDPAARFKTSAELAAAIERLDAHGKPLPRVRQLSGRLAMAGGILLVTLLGGTYWLARGPAVPETHKPVSILIADFENQADDKIFDGLVEPALSVGVESASFVTVYPRRDAVRAAAALAPGKKLDLETARLVSLREGINVIVGGSIAKQGSGYRVSATVIDPESKPLLTYATDAPGKDQVLAAVGRVAGKVRTTLGDKSDSGAQSEVETFTASSLEAAHAYSTAQALQITGKYDEAIAQYEAATKLDPDMGRAYAGLAALYANLGRTEDADRSYQAALSHINRMTDRERFRTRGGYYLSQHNSDKAVDEFKRLVEKYPADVAGLGNLALAFFYKRNMALAQEQVRKAVEIYPRYVIGRNNLALFAMYAGDFQTTEREAAEVLKLNPAFVKAFVATGLAQLALGRVDEAKQTYQRALDVSATGHLYGTAGLADLAMYEGRLADASAILEPVVKAEKDATWQARFEVMLAEVRSLQGRDADAAAMAKHAMSRTKSQAVQILGAHVLIDTGRVGDALEVIGTLGARLDAESQMQAAVLDAEISIGKGRAREAVDKLKAIQQTADSWMGRFDLGRAYLLAEAYTEADSEFDLCLKRRGEATSVLLDDVPTYRALAPVYYYQARVRVGMGSAAAVEAYKAFLAIKQPGDEKGLVADARRRAASTR